MATTSRDEILDRIRAEQQSWRALVDSVGRERMDQPGPMGDWTFKDLVSHLAAWRNRTIGRLDAAARGEPEPPSPWPSELDDDDSINAWIHERDRDLSLDEVLADYDSSFDRLAAAIAALPEKALTDPDYFPWSDGRPLVEADFFSHLRDEHEPSIREWLAKS
jgi:hypothetical protein